MKQESRHRLAWLGLAFAVLAVILMSGCSMLEEQMASMQASLGFAPDKDIILCEGVECVEAPAASETNTTE